MGTEISLANAPQFPNPTPTAPGRRRPRRSDADPQESRWPRFGFAYLGGGHWVAPSSREIPRAAPNAAAVSPLAMPCGKITSLASTMPMAPMTFSTWSTIGAARLDSPNTTPGCQAIHEPHRSGVGTPTDSQAIDPHGPALCVRRLETLTGYRFLSVDLTLPDDTRHYTASI